MTPLQTLRSRHRFLLVPACLFGLTAIGLAQQATPAPAQPDEDVVVLSPFEVVSDTRGYYSANTMSGTRFNTRIEDLASAVTIVTKEQMNDFAMLDINDVFLYTPGTEGTGTFTDVVIDRNGSVSDNVQLNPAQANRVRGIASANVSLNNIETQNRMPIDPIIVDAIEISRGPNANVFGLGNPSGTVNQVGASANLQRDSIRFEARADDWDGYRQSVDVNQVIIKDKLAVRFSQVFNHEEWVRKPSGVDTERYNFMVKYRPFKNTTISGAYYYHHMYGNRPNALPPRDAITYWQANGRPTWDPITRLVHVNGTTMGPYGQTNGNYNGPAGTPAAALGAGWLGSADSQVFIDENGQITHWSAATGATGTNPSQTIQPNRFLAPNSREGQANNYGTGTQPLWSTVPSIADKSIYDWSSINMAAPNRIWDKAEISTVQLDQIFLNTPRQTLAGQFTFLREESERYTRNFIGISNDNGLSGQLTIDVNEKLLDGTPNPYFLRPYITTNKPRTVYSPWKWDTYRAQLAYRFDFTQNQGFSKWLGWHQLTGYDEYKYRVQRQYSYRDTFVSNNSWIPAGLYRGNQSGVSGTPAVIAAARNNFRFYVGDANGENVDYAPRSFSYGTYEYLWGNVQTGALRRESSELGLGAVTDSAGGTQNTKRILKTIGGVLQSHFWNDSIVTTVGVRRDDVYKMFGSRNNQMLNTDGLTYNYEVVDAWESTSWRHNSGDTTNYQAVVRPFKNIKFFDQMASGTGASRFFGDLLSDMSVFYNRSDSFLPEGEALDIYRNPLPDPTGEDRSFGLNFALGDKLVVRLTHYKNTAKNSRNGDANAFFQRVSRVDVPVVSTTASRFVLWNVASAYTPSAANYNRAGWLTRQYPSESEEQIRQRAATLMQLPLDHIDFLINPTTPMAATNDIEAKGTEIEISYNPTAYWTVAASFEESETRNLNISGSLTRWIDERMPVWTSIVDPEAERNADNPNGLWWKARYPSATQTAEQNFIGWIQQPFSVIRELEGQASPQFSKYKGRLSTNFRLTGVTDNKWLKRFNVGGAIRYQSKQAIGYRGVQELPAIVTELDVTRPIYDKEHYYFDVFVGYKQKLFNDKVGMELRLNVQNLQEDGKLQPVGAYPDGTIHTYRIVDPRRFILTASFDL
ncbi:TonB-dependent receptor plug domain-containing protein [Opitutus terrae]|uniref:TonB-dependent receptor plug n=1 Tax=Opitutus terrae (strain DSM 11246 / JCM 15787 / PB90-1) TaxID=452637 RepID=B1ZP64_OPITP|nr:TonB-dependent receptor plug domain-containing protein [Opitutus terrae]ACB77553.1 TonB-dependent receptor plug [Opitutus terrae PB90-1]